MTCCVRAASNQTFAMSPSRDVIAPSRDVISAFSISLQHDEDTHPLQIKRKITQRRHSSFTTLEQFTNQGFVPFSPEGLVKKDSIPDKLNDQATPVRSPPRKFSDADIDQLSYLYSNNFDPSKSPPSIGKKKKERGRLSLLAGSFGGKFGRESLAGRLGVKVIDSVKEEETDGMKGSRSDSNLCAKKGRRYSTS